MLQHHEQRHRSSAEQQRQCKERRCLSERYLQPLGVDSEFKFPYVPRASTALHLEAVKQAVNFKKRHRIPEWSRKGGAAPGRLVGAGRRRGRAAELGGDRTGLTPEEEVRTALSSRRNGGGRLEAQQKGSACSHGRSEQSGRPSVPAMKCCCSPVALVLVVRHGSDPLPQSRIAWASDVVVKNIWAKKMTGRVDSRVGLAAVWSPCMAPPARARMTAAARGRWFGWSVLRRSCLRSAHGSATRLPAEACWARVVLQQPVECAALRAGRCPAPDFPQRYASRCQRVVASGCDIAKFSPTPI